MCHPILLKEAAEHLTFWNDINLAICDGVMAESLLCVLGPDVSKYHTKGSPSNNINLLIYAFVNLLKILN